MVLEGGRIVPDVSRMGPLVEGRAIGKVRQAIGKVRQAIGKVRQAIGKVRQAIGKVRQAIGKVRQAIGKVMVVGRPDRAGSLAQPGSRRSHAAAASVEPLIGSAAVDEAAPNPTVTALGSTFKHVHVDPAARMSLEGGVDVRDLNHHGPPGQAGDPRVRCRWPGAQPGIGRDGQRVDGVRRCGTGGRGEDRDKRQDETTQHASA